jgi:hypothetical protein
LLLQQRQRLSTDGIEIGIRLTAGP